MHKKISNQAGQQPQPTSRAKQTLSWLFTAIAVVLFARLIWVALRFAWWLIGWLAQGNVLERVEISNPRNLIINIVIVAIILILANIAKHEQTKVDTNHDESS